MRLRFEEDKKRSFHERERFNLRKKEVEDLRELGKSGMEGNVKYRKKISAEFVDSRKRERGREGRREGTGKV